MTLLRYICPDRRSGRHLFALAVWVALPTILTISAFGQLRGPKVKNEQELATTLRRPKAIYVSDFGINPADFAASGPAERLNNSGIKARINSLRGEDSSPEGKAQSIVNQMGNGIVENLQNKGLSSTRVRSGLRPSSGWVVRGRFSAVDQGNRAMKTAIGFGAGATNVNVDVTLNEIVNGKEKPILLFDTTNSNGNAPGGLAMAAATKNPYAIAIKFAMSGRDLQRNISKTAKLIADQIAKKAGA
jgi:hypothetical protein